MNFINSSDTSALHTSRTVSRVNTWEHGNQGHAFLASLVWHWMVALWGEGEGSRHDVIRVEAQQVLWGRSRSLGSGAPPLQPRQPAATPAATPTARLEGKHVKFASSLHTKGDGHWVSSLSARLVVVHLVGPKHDVHDCRVLGPRSL